MTYKHIHTSSIQCIMFFTSFGSRTNLLSLVIIPRERLNPSNGPGWQIKYLLKKDVMKCEGTLDLRM